MNWQKIYQQWQEFPNLAPDLKLQLSNMDEDELKEAFGAQLSFGTAGMRGIIGPGINRMNIYTVRQASEGLAQLILKSGEDAKKRGVVIAYDSRHFSPEFSLEAAKILGYHGIHVYLFESLRPTPELSFAVRFLGTEAGIMMTASHNPAEYNGFKVYGADGGQMPPEDAETVIEQIRKVEDPLTLQVAEEAELIKSGLLKYVGDDIDQAYLSEMKKVSINPELNHEMGNDVKIVFTPLHGTGYEIGKKALLEAGFKNVTIVEEQAEANGDFPTVKSPNPESPEAFVLAEEIGHKIEADILLATDPDADRLGAMIRTAEGNYQLLTGNQIASLMLDYIIKARQEQNDLPDNSVAVKSIVSTNLANRILEKYDLEMVEVLTGFKFIAEKIQEYQNTGLHTFLMGFEESYGYLIKPFARDKDAIQALVMLAELTAYHKKEGRTLGDAVIAMFEEYGYFEERTFAIKFPGLDGKEQMAQIMQNIRKEGLAELAGFKVVHSADYLNQIAINHEGIKSKIDFPPSDALKYQLEDGSWVAFRPSGTEPVIKLYLGVEGSSKEQVIKKADALEKAIQSLTK